MRSSSVFAVVCFAFLALGSMGCGGAAAVGRHGTLNAKVAKASPFPSREALDKIASTPAPPAPVQEVAATSEWSVDVSASDAPTPAEKGFASVAAKSESTISYSNVLRCIAREMGRFELEHGAAPDERLKRFIIAACGSTTTAIGLAVSKGEIPSKVPDAQILADWQKKLKVDPYRGHAVGVWMGRQGNRVVLMTAMGKAEAPVVVSQADASGVVVVRGTAPAGTEAVIGLVNQGERGVRRCEEDLQTALPLFAFRCPMAEGDKTAWVEVAARAEGRLLMRSIGLALARRDASARLDYVAAPHEARPATSSTELAAAVLDGVNRARAAAKLTPLVLAQNQSTTNERLAPHFLHAALQNNEVEGDKVGLGLLAGWDVEGTIRNGNLFSAWLSGTKDANGWLDYALEAPMGRFTMLEAGSRQIAIGAAPMGEAGGLGAVVTTYEFFGGNDHRPDVARVYERLARLRAARGAPAPVAFGSMKTLAAQAKLVNAGKRDADDALNEALMAERDRSGRSVRGWVLATNDLETMPFPPEALAAGPLAIDIEVTHFRPQGAAWGSYLVFFVMPTKDVPEQMTAKAERTPLF
jgi:hypothetical protein